MSVGGGERALRTYVQGATDFVFLAGFKNVLTHSILARPDIKRPADLKGKKIGINRIGSNPHYFAVQALRRSGIDPAEVNFMQSGGSPETLAALLSGSLDGAALNAPAEPQRGYTLCPLPPRPPPALPRHSLCPPKNDSREAPARSRTVSARDGGGG